MDILGTKLRVYCRQRSNKLSYSTKLSNNSSINIHENILRFKNPQYNYNNKVRVESQKREKVIIRYRIYHRRKTRFLDKGMYFPGIVEDLMDKLRGVLNIMLEDENGMYHKNEILKVSKELDLIIYAYYKGKITG